MRWAPSASVLPVKWALFITAILGGVGSAKLTTVVLSPGKCVRIKHEHICAAQTPTQTQTVVSTVVSTVTNTVTVQSPPPPAPDPLAIAVEQVRREVAYESSRLPYSQGRLVAQAAMDYVVGHVSASAYGYLETEGLPLPAPTASAVLAIQAGICGHAALTFAAIVRQFGFDARSVQFYYTDPSGPAGLGTPDSHIADEVFYDGGWHFFDATFGDYFVDANGDVLSITDERTSGGTEIKDLSSFTNLAEDYFYGNGTAFETDPATTVVLDGQKFP